MSAYRDYENQTYKAIPYVRGNVITKPEYVPHDPTPRKKVNPQVRQNRRREAALTKGTFYFLIAAAIALVAMCVVYLNLHSQIQIQSNQVTNLESEISSLKADNDARYNSINDSINLEDVRNHAINDLGMTYVTDNQIMLYSQPTEDFISQKVAIPKDTVE